MEDAPGGFAAWLVCPLCKGELDESPEALRCRQCSLDYPIEDGIPVMLAPEDRLRGEGDGAVDSGKPPKG